MKLVNIGLLLLLCQVYIEESNASDHEERLLRDKFKGYNKLVRPAKNISDVITVNFSIALFQIVDVDEKNEVMKTNVWLTMEWFDYQLSWDPEEYGGINAFRVPRDKIWNPDLVLFNNVDGKYEVTYKPNPVVYYCSRILYVPPSIYKSSCSMDVEYFPFDQQHCEMIFGSWTYNASEVMINLKNEQMVYNDYVYSGAWDLMDAPGHTYIDHNNDLLTVKYIITIRRKTLFYTINLITPCVLIAFLSVLLFYLPSDANEKITLGISILLSLVVFLLLVSKILPPTSLKFPLISKYLLFTFITNVFSILMTVIIINWNHRNSSTYNMRKWVKIVFLQILPKVLFIPRPHKKKLELTLSSKSIFYTDSSAFNDGQAVSKEIVISQDPAMEVWNLRVKTMAESTYFIANHMLEDREFNQVKEDWKYVAIVIDRLQLYLFFIVTVAGTANILMDAPYIFEHVDQHKRIQLLTAFLPNVSDDLLC